MKNIRYYAYWTLDKAAGSPVKNNFDEIENIMENMSEAEVAQWQKEKIGFLLKTASNNVPFYKDYRNYKQIQDCPVINKSDIKNNYDAFLSAVYRDKPLHKMSTSGSTGTPFTVLQNKEKRNRVIAELIYHNAIVGQYVGDKFIFYRVWTEKNKKSKLQQMKENIMPIDILHLDDANLKYIVNVLNTDKKIRSTLAYASTYDMILKYIKDHNMKVDTSVKAMISSSELLSDETRDGLEELLGCKVINRYSNQECGVLAQSNLHNKNMIINNASYYIEVLDIDKNAPVQDGEVGRIVVTDLFNYAMPLIRYDTGDLGTISTHSGKRAFSTIQGRRVDLIYDTKGRPLTPHTWGVYMWKFNKLKQYQFIQENRKQYVLKVNGAKGIYEKEEFELLLKEILGDDASIDVQFVDEIPTLASGKFKKTICNLREN